MEIQEHVHLQLVGSHYFSSLIDDPGSFCDMLTTFIRKLNAMKTRKWVHLFLSGDVPFPAVSKSSFKPEDAGVIGLAYRET